MRLPRAHRTDGVGAEGEASGPRGHPRAVQGPGLVC